MTVRTPVSRTRLALLCAASALLLSAPPARAGAVTLDFDDLAGAGPVITSNYIHDGFRMSPTGHYDIREADTGGGPFAWASTWFGFDSSGGCPSPGSYNTDFLGPSALAAGGSASHCGYVWVDFSEIAFTLLSLDVVETGNQWTVASSKGGYAAAPYGSGSNPFPTMNFSGDAWTDIEWLLFYAPGTGAPVGFDNLTFLVPEPAGIALVLTALGALGLASRRRPGSAGIIRCRT